MSTAIISNPYTTLDIMTFLGPLLSSDVQIGYPSQVLPNDICVVSHRDSTHALQDFDVCVRYDGFYGRIIGEEELPEAFLVTISDDGVFPEGGGHPIPVRWWFDRKYGNLRGKLLLLTAARTWDWDADPDEFHKLLMEAATAEVKRQFGSVKQTTGVHTNVVKKPAVVVAEAKVEAPTDAELFARSAHARTKSELNERQTEIERRLNALLPGPQTIPYSQTIKEIIEFRQVGGVAEARITEIVVNDMLVKGWRTNLAVEEYPERSDAAGMLEHLQSLLNAETERVDRDKKLGLL